MLLFAESVLTQFQEYPIVGFQCSYNLYKVLLLFFENKLAGDNTVCNTLPQGIEPVINFPFYTSKLRLATTLKVASTVT